MKTHYIQWINGAFTCVDCKEIVTVYGHPVDTNVRIAQLEHQVNVLQRALDNSKKSGR